MLTEKEIADLLADRKVIRRRAIRYLQQAGQCENGEAKRKQVRCRGASGREFSIFATFTAPKNSGRPPKYSVHMRYYLAGQTQFITLLRCNSPHGPHPNKIEKKNKTGVQLIPQGKCHIHMLTERYQNVPGKELGYAEETNAYNCFDSAVEHVCYSYGFYIRGDSYSSRFPLFGQNNQ